MIQELKLHFSNFGTFYGMTHRIDTEEETLYLRSLLVSFVICGILVYLLIIVYDKEELVLSISDHVEKDLVKDRNCIIILV